MLEYLSITNDVDRAKKFFESFLGYTTGPYNLHELIKKDVNSFNLVDVREYEDYTRGHIPFATHIPFEKLKDNLKRIQREKPTIVYCYDETCNLAKKAANVLLQEYFPTIELIGGFESWKNHGYDVVRTKATNE